MEMNKADLVAMLSGWPGKTPEGMHQRYELRLLIRAPGGVNLASVRIAGGDFDYVNALLVDGVKRLVNVDESHPIARIAQYVEVLNNEVEDIHAALEIYPAGV